MALVGFEMLIFSFGSGFNLENADALYLDKIKAQIAYAKTKGIEVGGYDLICLDRGGAAHPQWNAQGNAGGVSLACLKGSPVLREMYLRAPFLLGTLKFGQEHTRARTRICTMLHVTHISC